MVRQAALAVAIAALLGSAATGVTAASPITKGPRAVVFRLDGSGSLDYSLNDEWVDPTAASDCGTALPHHLRLRLHVPWRYRFSRIVVPARKFYTPVLSKPVTSDLAGSSYSFDANWYPNVPASCAPATLHCEGTLKPTEATFVADPDLDDPFLRNEFLRVYVLARVKGTQDPCPYLTGGPESLDIVFASGLEPLKYGFHGFRVRIESVRRLGDMTKRGTLDTSKIRRNCKAPAPDRANDVCTQSAQGSYTDHFHRLGVLR